MTTQPKHTTKSGFNALIWQEDDLFVAKTLEIELASQGKTTQEALDNLEEAIELYFEAVLQISCISSLTLLLKRERKKLFMNSK